MTFRVPAALLPVALLCQLLFSVASPAFAAALFDAGLAPGAHGGLPSLHGSTGLLDMPSARVLEDFEVRGHAGSAGPYRFYGASLGLFDRLEVTGELTTVTGRDPFPGEGFGDYKDRSAGFRWVLLPEDDTWPQVALGASDVTGTGLFASRYLVATGSIFGFDLTFGLGQGILGGEDVARLDDSGEPQGEGGAEFLFSSPWRRTRAFGGLEYPLTNWLALTAEYSPVDPATLYGYDARPDFPFNFGLKLVPFSWLTLGAGLLRGRDGAVYAAASLPLEPEGFFAWVREEPPEAAEADRFRAHNAHGRDLALLVAESLAADGFAEVTARVRGTAVWVEAAQGRYQSEARAVARLGRLLDGLLPERIDTLYLNLTRDGLITLSLKTGRAHLAAFLQSRIDREAFLALADVDVNPAHHRREFIPPDAPRPEEDYLAALEGDAGDDPAWVRGAATARSGHKELSFALAPKIRTFLGNRDNYLHQKVVAQARAAWRPSREEYLLAEVETTLYNDYDTLVPEETEPDAVRTDAASYEARKGTRLTALAYDTISELGYGILGRSAFGYFESAYAGVQGELFRYFANGRLGLGLESSVVAKRDPDAPFAILAGSPLYATALVTGYANLSPELGLELGVGAGRFLAGDPGVRVDLRRTFRHFTIGAWYTATDTSRFVTEANRGFHEQGIYIEVPLSVFEDHDAGGRFTYSLVNFTRDPGQTVRQVRSLYPLSPEGLPPAFTRDADAMRR